MPGRDRDRAILVKILGDASSLSRALGKSSKDLDGWQKRVAQVGKVIRTGAIVGAVAIAAVGVASVKMAADFDTSMREVNTLLGQPAEGFEALRQQTLDLSKEMGVLPSKTVPALYQAISAGVPKDNVFEFLEIAQKAAVGGVTDLTTSVDALTTATNAWASQNLTADDAADILFTAVKGGKTTFAELGGAIGRVAPLAAATGVSFEETAAAIATLTTQGQSTTEAVTNIRSAITAVLRPSEELTKIFRAQGQESAETALRTLGLQDTLQILVEATGGSTAELGKLLGSQEAVNAALGITGPNMQAFSKQMDAMAARTGAAGEAFAEMEKSASRAWERIQARLQVGMINLGSRILPGVVKALDAFGEWWDRNEPQIEAAIDAIAAAATGFLVNFKRGLDVVFPVMQRLFNFIASDSRTVVLALGAIGVAVTLAFGPVGIAVVAIVAVIALIGRFKDSWQGMAISVVSIIEKMTNGILTGLDAVIDKIGDLLEFGLNPVLGLASKFGVGPGKVDILSGGLGGSVDLGGVRDAIAGTRSRSPVARSRLEGLADEEQGLEDVAGAAGVTTDGLTADAGLVPALAAATAGAAELGEKEKATADERRRIIDEMAQDILNTERELAEARRAASDKAAAKGFGGSFRSVDESGFITTSGFGDQQFRVFQSGTDLEAVQRERAGLFQHGEKAITTEELLRIRQEFFATGQVPKIEQTIIVEDGSPAAIARAAQTGAEAAGKQMMAEMAAGA